MPYGGHMQVRPFNHDNPKEADRVRELARSFFEESDFRNRKYNEDKFNHIIHSAKILGDNVAFFYVIEANDEVHGGMIAFADAQIPFDDLIVQDAGFFIAPEYRKGIGAYRIVEKLLGWSKEINAAEVCVGVTAGIDDEAAARLYEHFGFNPQGTLYRKVL